jgi:hypothetical protein
MKILEQVKKSKGVRKITKEEHEKLPVEEK